MGAFILVTSVFVLGAGFVLGAYMLFTKLPGYLAQRKLDTRLLEITTPDAPEGEEGGDLVKRVVHARGNRHDQTGGLCSDGRAERRGHCNSYRQ